MEQRDQARSPLSQRPLTVAQMEQLEKSLLEASQLPYGVVRIEFKNGKPRFIYVERSEEMVRE